MNRIITLLFLSLCLFVTTSFGAALQGERPVQWAQPVVTSALKNFYQLDAKLYRSAQPDEAGFAAIKRLGITTVLNLRDFHNDADEAAGLGLNLQRIEMEAGKITVPQLVEALRLIRAAEGPVLIHCWHGSDRTGTVAALYRMVMQGWRQEEAIDELVKGGYGYHAIYENIPELLRQVDVVAIRAAVLAP